ncbi:hypothetical protein JYT28_01210 [Desulfobulbus sp. AH-315-M07]|nr:hypothetical protein [Desulfobulbus sp. AH-315-M07]
MKMRTTLSMLGIVVAGCSPPHADAPSDKSASVTTCHYEATWDDPKTLQLRVRVSCDGSPLKRFVASERVMAHLLEDVSSNGSAVQRQGRDVFVLPSSNGRSTIAYRIDLDDVAQGAQSVDVAYREGASWIVPLSTWMLRPDPLPARTAVTLTVSPPDGAAFATPLRYEDGRYYIKGYEIRHGTYAVFGNFRRTTLRLPGPLSQDSHDGKKALVDVVTLDGPLSVGDEVIETWLRDATTAVSNFYHGFPVARSMVVLVPKSSRRSVLHGKVVANGGAAAVIQVGEHTTKPRLYDDWILVHELMHFGFPSFFPDGRWLDEGLATYFEPIIRARSGWTKPSDVWTEFARDMHQGLDAVEADGVRVTEDVRGMYWGGAIIALMADVEIRKRSGGKQGLEDAMRAVLAEGGNATEVWSLEDTVAVMDRYLGSDTMRRLVDKHTMSGSPVGFWGLLRDLGVVRTGSGVRFNDDAPLAEVRKAIVLPPN